MPGTLRSTSRSVVAFCSSITARGITVIVCGMSRSGSVYFGDDGSASGEVTSIASERRSCSVTATGAVKRLGDTGALEQLLQCLGGGVRARDAGALDVADRLVRGRDR